MPDGTYGGVRGGGREAPAYSMSVSTLNIFLPDLIQNINSMSKTFGIMMSITHVHGDGLVTEEFCRSYPWQ